jgi:hypothetical protein
MAGTMLRTRGERLRAARLKHFKSARLAAIALRMPVSTYGAHERAEAPGGRDYGPEEATRYARRFGVIPEWLLTGWRPPQQEQDGEAGRSAPLPAEELKAPVKATIPVRGYISAGPDAYRVVDSQGRIVEIDLSTEAMAKSLTLAVRDSSLGSFFDEWLVICHPRDVAHDLFGYLCAVVLGEGQEDPSDDGRLVLRVMQPGRTEGKFDLLSEFEKNYRDVSVYAAAKVKYLLPIQGQAKRPARSM